MTFPIYRVQMVHADHMKTRHFHNVMLRTEEEAATYFAENEQNYRTNIGGDTPEQEFEFTWTLLHHETWCCEWFCHYTFRDRFEDPAEVLADFEQYVNRMIQRQGRGLPGPKQIEEYEIRTGNKWVCLMGAEERHRWAGQEEGSAPPCDCQHCKDAGVWRINH